MTIWAGLVLLGVIVMVVGPIMLLQPSARDRRLGALRAQAQQRGIKVTMQSLPSQATDTADACEPVPRYQLAAARGGGPSRSWMLVRGVYEHEAHFLDYWVWQGAERPGVVEQQCLATVLPRLPKSVRAVSGDAMGWSIYWMELGGEAALEQLLEGLFALRDCNRPQASAPH